jgi:hypothetical protein
MIFSRLFPRIRRKFVRELNLIQVFKDSISRQIKDNADFKNKINLIGDSTEALAKKSSATSELLKEKGKVIMDAINPIISPIGQTIAKTGETVATGIEKIYHAVDSSATPIKSSEIYKSFKSAKNSIVDNAMEVAPKDKRISNFKALKPIKTDDQSTSLEAIKPSIWSSYNFNQPKWMDMNETEQATITR